MGKPVVFGIPVVMVTALLAVLGLWAWGPIAAGGPTSNAGLTWNVEYWHRNADGEVLQHKNDSNTVTGVGVESALDRLINAGTDGDRAGEADTFDQIVLLDVAYTVNEVSAVPTTSMLQNVDGGAAASNQNPADGAFTDVAASVTDGQGEVGVTFTATAGNPPTAVQMLLGKFAEQTQADNTDPTLTIAAVDILASIVISVDLAPTDTLTITWTIDVNPV